MGGVNKVCGLHCRCKPNFRGLGVYVPRSVDWHPALWCIISLLMRINDGNQVAPLTREHPRPPVATPPSTTLGAYMSTCTGFGKSGWFVCYTQGGRRSSQHRHRYFLNSTVPSIFFSASRRRAMGLRITVHVIVADTETGTLSLAQVRSTPARLISRRSLDSHCH